MALFFFLFILLVAPLAHLLIGEWVLESIFAKLKKTPWSKSSEPDSRLFIAYYFLGLLLFLIVVFVLASLGIPLSVASFFSFCPAIWLLGRFSLWRARWNWRPSLNFSLWFTVVLTFGISLLSTVDGIQTPWRNSYGDSTWHLGMIASFVFGQNLPPENHLFAGEVLSYHFLVNLWSAALWSFWPTLTGIHWIFVYQWVLIWVAVFYLLDSKNFPLLPWTLLFGGGAFYVVWRALGIESGIQFSAYGPYAHDLISHGYPWTPFLTTIWVTQRSALFGLPLMLASVTLAHRALYFETERMEKDLLLAGLLLGLSPLAHTHLFLIGSIYLFCLIAVEGFRRQKFFLKWFLAGIIPAPLFAPWILTKSHIVQIAGAWMQEHVYQSQGLLASVEAGAKLWFENAFWWLVLSGFAVFLTRKYLSGLILLALFLAANFFLLAVWDWDEIKVFLALYIISISMWSLSNTPMVRRAHWTLVLLLIPALTELIVTLKLYQRYTMYSAEEVIQARDLRMFADPRDVIAAAPDHNSLVTISGRRMFYGYEGALHAYGIDYQSRQKMFKDLDALKTCLPADDKICPKYLLWTWREKKYWQREEPGPGVERTRLSYVYRFPLQK